MTVTVLKKDRCKLRDIKVDKRAEGEWVGRVCACGKKDKCDCYARKLKHAHQHGMSCRWKYEEYKHEEGCG